MLHLCISLKMIQEGLKHAGNTELYCSRLVCPTTTLSVTCLSYFL